MCNTYLHALAGSSFTSVFWFVILSASLTLYIIAFSVRLCFQRVIFRLQSRARAMQLGFTRLVYLRLCLRVSRSSLALIVRFLHCFPHRRYIIVNDGAARTSSVAFQFLDLRRRRCSFSVLTFSIFHISIGSNGKIRSSAFTYGNPYRRLY